MVIIQNTYEKVGRKYNPLSHGIEEIYDCRLFHRLFRGLSYDLFNDHHIFVTKRRLLK